MQSLLAAGEKFRGAVSSGAFAEAEQLLGVYRREVEICWNTASASERRAIEADVTSLLKWARTTTLSARAHAQSKLILLSRQSAYTCGGVRKTQVFNLNA